MKGNQVKEAIMKYRIGRIKRCDIFLAIRDRKRKKGVE